MQYLSDQLETPWSLHEKKGKKKKGKKKTGAETHVRVSENYIKVSENHKKVSENQNKVSENPSRVHEKNENRNIFHPTVSSRYNGNIG